MITYNVISHVPGGDIVYYDLKTLEDAITFANNQESATIEILFEKEENDI